MDGRDTHYQILGISPRASPAEVRQAFLRAIRETHPDTATEFVRDPSDVIAAYRCLKDASSRAAYDSTLSRQIASGMALVDRWDTPPALMAPRSPWLSRTIFGLVIVCLLAVIVGGGLVLIDRPQAETADVDSPKIETVSRASPWKQPTRLSIEARLDTHWVVTLYGVQALPIYSQSCFNDNVQFPSEAQCAYCEAFDLAAAERATADVYFSVKERSIRSQKFCAVERL